VMKMKVMRLPHEDCVYAILGAPLLECHGCLGL